MGFQKIYIDQWSNENPHHFDEKLDPDPLFSEKLDSDPN
jgi:hypothetical protein